ncbi:MAG: hypothetical protein GX868_18970 [Actinobacteria bacterium]|nr:hypothetical protein [Actinomycetota bacterium]
MNRPSRSTGRRTRLASLTALACLAAGCGNPADEAATDTSEPPLTASTISTTSTPTTTTVPELPPCDPAAEFHQVVADWLPDAMPEGWEIVYGATLVSPRQPGSDGAEWWSFSLGERLDDDRLGLRLDLGATVDEDPSHLGIVDEEPVLTTVRGRPGTVGRWVNRGDSVGSRMARWEEQGLHWHAATASDALTNEELAAIVDRLVISRDGVVDPTGTLTMLGRSRSGPPVTQDRSTRVVLRRAGAPANERVQIDVVAPVDGTEGLLHSTGDQLLEDDRGMIVSDGRRASARQSDGLGLDLEAIDMSGHGNVAPLSMTDLEMLLLTPWARVAPDDPRRRTVALADPDYSAEPSDFCRE